EAELQAVLSMCPGKVVPETVDGPLKFLGVIQGMVKSGIETSEGVPGEIGIANGAKTLANKTVPKIVNERVGDYRGVVCDQTFIVVDQISCRGLSRQKWRIGLVLVCQSSSKRDALFAILRDVVIQLRDVPVFRISGRGRKTKARGIESITLTGVVRQWIRVEEGEHGGIRADGSGIARRRASAE